MRKINLDDVTKEVRNMLIQACEDIPCDVLKKLKDVIKQEESPLGKKVIEQIILNDELAKNKHLPICQDTGVVVCFVELGTEVKLEGNLYDAINKGVAQAYVEGYLRKSVVRHPLDRVNTKDNTPAIVHIKLVEGDTFKVHLAPKGGGSENMSLVKMLIPADGISGIKELVLDTVLQAGGKPCPPIIVGIGIGGNLEKSALLAKEALLRPIDDESEHEMVRTLEHELLQEINNLGVGPMGFGGTVTCLAVKINTYPCHIASLPVAINIQCHAARHRTFEL